jgi:hypothetical protein
MKITLPKKASNVVALYFSTEDMESNQSGIKAIASLPILKNLRLYCDIANDSIAALSVVKRLNTTF